MAVVILVVSGRDICGGGIGRDFCGGGSSRDILVVVGS